MNIYNQSGQEYSEKWPFLNPAFRSVISDHLEVRRGFFGKLDTDKIMDKGILIDQMT